MEWLPSGDEQEYLLEGLAVLIDKRGHGPFVAGPLIEPDDRFFPDRWQPDGAGVKALTKRLLRYAGLSKLRVHLTFYTNPEEVELDGRGDARSYRREGAAAWFAGIDDGTAHFGVDTNQLREPAPFVGVMAHEVAHAYRTRHGIVERDHALEEEMTDLTTVYLGFGVLTTNSAYRVRTSGDFDGYRATYQVSQARTGYLSPQSMSFLLAAQVVARGLDAAERRRIAGLLETNQAAFFKRACKTLDADNLIERLGLPARESWPPAASGPATTESAGTWLTPVVAKITSEVVEPDDDPPTRPNEGRPVFRVPKTRAGRWSGIGLALGAVAAIGVMVAQRRFHAPVPTAFAILALPTGAVLGWIAGRRRRRLICSDPSCKHALADQETCPGCGGEICGTIAHENDRLEAEEAVTRTTRLPPRGPYRDPPRNEASRR
jgi:hypothetical protein